MSELKVSNIEQEFRTNRNSNSDTTAKSAQRIEIFADNNADCLNAYSVERTDETKSDKIAKLEKSIEKDIRQLNILSEKQKNVANGGFERTEKQEKIMCGIGGVSFALGTVATWAIDKKCGFGGTLGLFTALGTLGGGVLTVAAGGITALIMKHKNKKQYENELRQIEQLQAKINEEQQLLKQLNEIT